MSKTILFFGNERLATGVTTTTPTLRSLIEAGYKIAAVVVAQAEADKSRQARQLEIADLAAENNIPVISPYDLKSAKSQLADFGAEAAVLIAYGKLVPQEVIDLFPKGIVNVHPSLLPKHRGSTPLESIILDGATETGVSLMKLAAKMDAGPVYAQEKVSLSGSETKQELADKLSDIGSKLVIENLSRILDDSLQPTAQDDSAATEDQHITKEVSILDWSKPADRLEREVRAYLNWPRSRTKLGSTEVIITKAHVESGSGQAGSIFSENKKVGFYTAKDVFVIDSLIPAGKKEMPAAAFIAGYKF